MNTSVAMLLFLRDRYYSTRQAIAKPKQSGAHSQWKVDMSRFEWMVALRYLRAKRKQTVISVITVISILGVAAGVAALTIALAINNGFQTTLQASLLSATAHVSVLEVNPEFGIVGWEEMIPKLKQIPHVVSATPGLYGQVAIKGP